MDVFLTQTHRFRRPFLNPWGHKYNFYDGWMHFLGFKIEVTIHSHY